MSNQRNKKILKWILICIPFIAAAAALYLIHTTQTIVVRGDVTYPAEENNNSYVIEQKADSVIELSVPRGLEEYPPVILQSQNAQTIDIYPSIIGMHFRHTVLSGKSDDASGMNVFTLTTKYIRKNTMVLRTYENFFMWAAAAALVFYLFFLLDCRRLAKGEIPSALRLLLAILTGGLAAGLNDGYSYLEHNFRNISFHELLYYYNTDLEGANFSEFSGLIKTILAHVGIVAAVCVLIYCLKRTSAVKKFVKRFRIPDLISYWAVIAAAFLGCIYPIIKFFTYFNVFDYLGGRKVPSVLYETYYVDPANAEITFPEQKKNLIYIYLESMEMTSSDEAHGGIEPVDTIPDLTKIALENTCFNGDEDILNGGIPMSGATWTIGGMVAQSTGLPLRAGNGSLQPGMMSNFMPGATAIGDILDEEGYRNVLMIGSDAAFANRDSFYGHHGNYEICDYYWAVREGLIPEDYYVWWGFEDWRLFDYAKDKVSELAAGDEPFNLTLLTVDTHFTDGYLCEKCGDEFDTQYANVVKCSNNLVSAFVEWVQEQEWADDTVIVLSGDHLYKDDKYFDPQMENQPDNYQRKTYVTFINSAKPEPEEWKDFTTMDLFPTTLSALGCDIKGGRLGLGTDLYSDVPPLLDVLGKDEFNDELSLYSSFYEGTLMLGGKNRNSKIVNRLIR